MFFIWGLPPSINIITAPVESSIVRQNCHSTVVSRVRTKRPISNKYPVHGATSGFYVVSRRPAGPSSQVCAQVRVGNVLNHDAIGLGPRLEGCEYCREETAPPQSFVDLYIVYVEDFVDDLAIHVHGGLQSHVHLGHDQFGRVIFLCEELNDAFTAGARNNPGRQICMSFADLTVWFKTGVGQCYNCFILLSPLFLACMRQHGKLANNRAGKRLSIIVYGNVW
jgi:hypothetical protein